MVMYELLYQTMLYAILMVLTLFAVCFLYIGLFWKFIKVRASSLHDGRMKMNKEDKIRFENLVWPLRFAIIYSWLMIAILVYYFFKGYFLY